MKSFLKIFLASFVAIIVFTMILFFLFAGILVGITKSEKVQTGSNAILVLDLSQQFKEVGTENPLGAFASKDYSDVPSLNDAVRLIEHAAGDSAVKGIYIKCGNNVNGFGASEELRNALAIFKKTDKFIYAYADVITQGGYRVANIADQIWCNPAGGLDWKGFSFQLTFLKGTLDKLEIEPQIFYAGKFKSATEPLRTDKMTDANRLQLTELINDLYDHFLVQTAEARKIDTATLHRYANENLILTSGDAVKYKLLDGVKYEDEIRTLINSKTRAAATADVNFVTLGKYAKATSYKNSGTDRIAVIYAQGDIIDGKGGEDAIGSDAYRDLVRKARQDDEIKAIVFRINSGGGSAIASENIWRELTLAKAKKPVVVSFGDVSASGGYYLSCSADSIFAQPNTITGSIGVFSVIPNLQQFFKNKLGVTFDGVKTSPDADAPTTTKPLTETQKRYLQNDVDTIYHLFKTRVAEGRKMDIAYVDSIGQGRVWSGVRAVKLGLVDRLGGLQSAIACAARMAKTSSYRLNEYPEPHNILERYLGSFRKEAKAAAIQEELGPEGLKVWKAVKSARNMVGIAQTRMPFELIVE